MPKELYRADIKHLHTWTLKLYDCAAAEKHGEKEGGQKGREKKILNKIK
jgi:hypothetical protein